jgi:putative ABC transport system permease protein
MFADTTTTPAGKVSNGKIQYRKDLSAIIAEHYVPYVAQTTLTRDFKDLHRKAETAIYTKGAAFLNMMREQGVPEADLEWNVQSLEESVAETFSDQRNTLKIISLFTIIAIVISILGYIGMSLFFIRQRQKEIAIRKIMGGTSHEIMLLMLRTFCAPLLVSFVIAVPLSWYIMNDWLSNFSYRIALSPWMFAATCTFALVVAVLSVGIQIVKAVRTNPVESIKTE